MNENNFWNDIDNANLINKEVSSLKKDLSLFKRLEGSIKGAIEIYSISETDESLAEELSEEIDNISRDLEELEISYLLNGEYDNLNCYLEIHPGAGGTESCDWANMLYRMYTRYFEKNDYKYEVIDEQPGEEAGIKSVTLLVKKEYAYGYLKGEKGIHRLVRISPFDSNKRRHTSFASVMIIPEFNNDNIDIEINEADLKIDVYHSSGAGGQSVNTSDSAVRITHIPSKIVVSCQTERSQLKNKERAMNMLRNKLQQRELEKQQEQLDNIKGNNINIEFGNQIRSYILEPYTLVKDHRTNYETSQSEKVLDGEIEGFLKANLKN